MTKLSVNLNKVALLRNQRDIGYPDLLKTARLVLDSGAHGLTVHPRPDERHIRRADIADLAAIIKDYKRPFPSFMMEKKDTRDHIEFNIEGYPDDDFLKLVTAHPCDQVTLVPDAPDQKTSDHGWDITRHKALLSEVIPALKKAGRRVALFIDPSEKTVEEAAALGADRIELFTGPYAFDKNLIDAYVRAAIRAERLGLGVNAGHDLNLDNLARFIAALPGCAEVSIGHAITADALEMGWRGAVAAYLSAIEYGRKSAPELQDKDRAEA